MVFVSKKDVIIDMWNIYNQDGYTRPSMSAIARAVGVSISYVRLIIMKDMIGKHMIGKHSIGSKTKLIDWSKQPIGRISDAELARSLNLSAETVRLRRVRMGIPAYAPKSSIDWSKVPLGKIPDCAIVRQFGIPLTAVRRRRQAMGIGPAKRKWHSNGGLKKEIDQSVLDTWVTMFLDGKSIKEIKSRYTGHSKKYISESIKGRFNAKTLQEVRDANMG